MTDQSARRTRTTAQRRLVLCALRIAAVSSFRPDYRPPTRLRAAAAGIGAKAAAGRSTGRARLR
jgi:hypothetical protein